MLFIITSFVSFVPSMAFIQILCSCVSRYNDSAVSWLFPVIMFLFMKFNFVCETQDVSWSLILTIALSQFFEVTDQWKSHKTISWSQAHKFLGWHGSSLLSRSLLRRMQVQDGMWVFIFCSVLSLVPFLWSSKAIWRLPSRDEHSWRIFMMPSKHF